MPVSTSLGIKWLIPGQREGKHKMPLKNLVSESNILKKDEDMSKGNRSPLEGTCTYQIWDNSSIINA